MNRQRILWKVSDVTVGRGKLSCPKCGSPIYATDTECLSCGIALDQGRILVSFDDDASNGAREAYAAVRAEPARPAMGIPRTPAGSGREAPYRTDGRPLAWQPADMAGSPGLLGSLSRAWAFFVESLRMANEDQNLLAPSILSISASLVLCIVMLLVMYMTGTMHGFVAEDGGLNWLSFALVGGLCFASYVIHCLMTGMTVNMLDANLKGREAQLGVAWADAINNGLALVWVAFVGTVISMVTALIRSGGRRRSIADMAADAVDRMWTVAMLLAIPVIIIEDASFRQAVSRVKSLHRQSLVQIMVGEVGIEVLARLLAIAAVAIGLGPLMLMSTPASSVLFFVMIGWAIVVVMVASVLLWYVRTSFYTCVYLWAVATEEAGSAVPMPAPLESVMRAA